MKFLTHKLSWLEWTALALSIWFFIYPWPAYKILFTVLLLIPILGLVLNGLQQPSIASLIAVPPKGRKDIGLGVADYIDVPALVITLRLVIDYEVESFYSLVKVGSVGFALVLIVLFLTHRQRYDWKQRKIAYLIVIGNIALYSYSATYGINCVYDKRGHELYETKALDKYIVKGRKGATTYYIKVAPWGHHHEVEEISVSSEDFYQVEPGTQVVVEYNKGLLGIPWIGGVHNARVQ